MAQAAVDAGTTTIACTSHIHPRYPTPPGVIHEGVRDLQGRLDALDVPLRVMPGGELSLEWLPRMTDAEPGHGLPGRRRLAAGGDAVPGVAAAAGRDAPRPGDPGYGVSWPTRSAPRRYSARPTGCATSWAAAHWSSSTPGRSPASTGPAPAAPQRRCCGPAGPLPGVRRPLRRALAPPGLGDGLDAAARALRVEPDALRWMVEDGPRAVVEGRPVRPPRLTPSRTPRADAGRAPGVRRSPSRG